MWGFLFVMIRLLDVVAVVMEKDGGLLLMFCLLFWRYETEVKFRQNRWKRFSLFLQDVTLLLPSHRVPVYFSVYFLFFPPCLFWVCLHIAKTNQEMVSLKLSRCTRWLPAYKLLNFKFLIPFQIPLYITMLVPLWAYWSDSSPTSKPIYMLLICYSSILETKWRFLRLTNKKKRQNPLIHVL